MYLGARNGTRLWVNGADGAPGGWARAPAHQGLYSDWGGLVCVGGLRHGTFLRVQPPAEPLVSSGA